MIAGCLNVEAIVVHERTAISGAQEHKRCGKDRLDGHTQSCLTLFQPRTRTMISTITIALTVNMSAMLQFAVLQAWVCVLAPTSTSPSSR